MWNGDVVMFAHGYVPKGAPSGTYLQQLVLPDGTEKGQALPAAVLALGYAFAAPSFHADGLAVLEGMADIVALLQALPAHNRTYIAGASEGGLISTRLLEDPATRDFFAGGLAACGPIGSFRNQINYFGDFRVLFDYFFPGVLPGSPIAIPPELPAFWFQDPPSPPYPPGSLAYSTRVAAALQANPQKAAELIRTARAAIDPHDPATVGATALNVLWYNVFATTDAQERLGGNPYDNTRRWYFGSSNDWRLNGPSGVKRFAAAPAALAALAPYETSGRLTRPLVTLHTTGDEIVPFWHELLYFGKLRLSENGGFLPIPIARYGHCNFTASELQVAFAILVWRVTGSLPELPAEAAAAQAGLQVAQFHSLYLPQVSVGD
jgi:hypothetical protein